MGLNIKIDDPVKYYLLNKTVISTFNGLDYLELKFKLNNKINYAGLNDEDGVAL